MSGRYAARTPVAADKSKTDIERTLTRYGAGAFAYGWDRLAAVVMFELGGRRIRFRLPLPDTSEVELTSTGRRRSADAMATAYEQAVRQRWRALLLVIKAKLEAVETGLVSVESEFLAHLVLPSGETLGEWVAPQLAAVYDGGRMPALLPGGER